MQLELLKQVLQVLLEALLVHHPLQRELDSAVEAEVGGAEVGMGGAEEGEAEVGAVAGLEEAELAGHLLEVHVSESKKYIYINLKKKNTVKYKNKLQFVTVMVTDTNWDEVDAETDCEPVSLPFNQKSGPHLPPGLDNSPHSFFQLFLEDIIQVVLDETNRQVCMNIWTYISLGYCIRDCGSNLYVGMRVVEMF